MKYPVLSMFPAEPILLDGLLQAVMLKTGDVVAVRTQARPIPTYFGCFEHQMQLNPKSIHRPVLAALMQVRCYSLLQVESGLDSAQQIRSPNSMVVSVVVKHLRQPCA